MKININRASLMASTLVEVVAAVAILAISAGGLMAALASGFRTMQMARENQRATQVLMERAEMLRLYNWEQVTNGVVPATFTEIYDPQDNEGCTYKGTITIDSVPYSTSYSSDMRRVVIRLKWETQGIPRNRVLTTQIAKDGQQNYFL